MNKFLLAAGCFWGAVLGAGAAENAEQPRAAAENAAEAAAPAATLAGFAVAEETLRLLNMEKVYQTALDEYGQELSDLGFPGDAGRELLDKYLGFPVLKPWIIKVYLETFSENELKEFNVFLSAAPGRKLIEQYPKLLQKMPEAARKDLNNNFPEFQKIAQAAFTPEEWPAVSRFLSSPLGRKWLGEYPGLLAKMHALTKAEVKKHAAEFQKKMVAPATPAQDKE